MAKIGLPKGSGKRLKVREKSVKSQGILKWILSGNPAILDLMHPFLEFLYHLQTYVTCSSQVTCTKEAAQTQTLYYKELIRNARYAISKEIFETHATASRRMTITQRHLL